jgi:hypothetical protein
MSNPKDKDYTQAIKESYDPDLNRLRVDAIINDGVDALVINSDGSINVSVLPASNQSSTSTITSVNGNASSVSLLSSNSNRKGASFFNDSTSYAFLKLGATASTTSYTVKIGPYGLYEIPLPAYTGAIDCIWTTANGAMRITELT